MDKRAVMLVTALLALGAGIGFFWRKLEHPPAAELAQAPGGPAMPPGTAATPVSEQLLAEKLRTSLDGGGAARPDVPQVPASPEVLQKRAEIRDKLRAMYPDLATALQLTPEVAEQFLDLLARQQLEIAELIATRPGDNRNGVYSQRLARDINVMELSDDAEQAALLTDKYPDWLQFQQDDLNINPVDKLHGTLTRQGIDITTAVTDELATALAAEQTRLSREMARASEPASPSPRQLLEQELQNGSNNRQLVGVASRYLNPQQLEIFEQLLQQRARTAQRLLRTTRDESGE
jgi:hypothetical protein